MSALNVAQLRQQVTALANAVAGKQAERTAIANQIAALNSLPASKGDLKALVGRWVDDAAQSYLKGLAVVLEPFARNWSRPPTVQNPLELLHSVRTKNATGLMFSQSPEGLFYLLGPAIKTALESAIDALDMPAGIDSDDRAAQLKPLVAQLAAVDSELAELAALANGTGVIGGDFEINPAVKEARRLSALAEKRSADEAKRKARQAEMPCGDFPTDRPLSKPRPSEQSEFEKGQARLDALAANRGG
jgi:hypothetical protein